MIATTLVVPASPAREIRACGIPAAGSLLPLVALAATVAIYQLGGLAGLAALARGSRLAQTTVDYPIASHRS
ncbi:MAG: hypothetical protein M0D55_15145 [Elusimicrobiota bacterium]|nr:MAG: hypothetical protein M0D55_15145 [Elusimicrobiota bacterium]